MLKVVVRVFGKNCSFGENFKSKKVAFLRKNCAGVKSMGAC